MWCHVLRTADELVAARSRYRSRGLCPPTDSRKAWDNLIALDALERVAFNEPIADIGCRSGILLTWLHQSGYRELWGCDVQRPLPPFRQALIRWYPRTFIQSVRMFARNRSRMYRSRAEDTRLPTGMFAAVTAMSVIEHSVDTVAFFREAARMLRPGGILFVSTDYWSSPMTTGAGDLVFGPDDIDRLLDEASSVGLRAFCRPPRDVGSPVIAEAGLRYTFLTLAFRTSSEH